MRQYLFALILAFITAFAVTGCTEEFNHDEDGEGLKISLSCGTQTKATQLGVGNENLIKTVDVFLFPHGTGKYSYRFHEEPGVQTNYTMYIGSSFAPEDSYTVFAIVNYPYSDISDLNTDFGTNDNSDSRKTLDELKAIVVSESEHHTFTADAGSSKTTVASDDALAMVMTGQVDNVTISTTSGSNIVGNASIDLSRLAAKVTMDFYLQDELVNDVYGNGSVIETWTPITEGRAIRAYLCNGNQSIELCAATPPDVSSANRFDYVPNTDMTAITGKTGYTAAFSIPAFYTYPESWTRGNANEPYIKLIVQWSLSRTTASGTTTSQKETYYKVMLPTTSFASNTWYDLKLDVIHLGGSSEADAVPVVPSYQVAPWGGKDVPATLVRSYYLSVSEENKNLAMYVDKVDIPFNASGDVSLKSVTIKSHDFLADEDITYDNATVQWVTIDNVNSMLTINRPIATNFPDVYDVSQYIYTITLHLDEEGEGSKYDETLVVTQYPPLYISSLNASGTTAGIGNNSTNTTFVNGLYNNSSSNEMDVYDNTGVTARSTANASHYLGSVMKPERAVPDKTASNYTGINQNPNLYTVTATNVGLMVSYDGQTTEAVIGDPRNATAISYTAPNTMNGGTTGSELTGYHATADNTKNYIAPIIMSASSFGKTRMLSYEGAVNRCAAYQEFGYPAGRWRLPTVAEVTFLLELSEDRKIPSLFNTDVQDTYIRGYWAAGKELYTDNGFVNLDSASMAWNGSLYSFLYDNGDAKKYAGAVRCVYDIWYWGDNHSATTSNSWLGFKTSRNDTF